MTNPTTHSPGPVARLHGGLLAAAAATAIVVTLLMGVAASRWIDQPFPGFFVLANRVIPSVGLTGWPATREHTLYQQMLVEVDGAPLTDARTVYQHVARRDVGTPVTYTLREGLATTTLTLPTARFTRWDYWLIFGSYLGTGLLYLLLALGGVWLFPSAHLGRAIFAVGSIGGIYALSGASLYGAGAAFQVHALAEACFPAAFVYLALAFPAGCEKLIKPVGAVAAWLSLALAVPYVLLLDHPGAYSTLHGAAEAYMGLAGAVLTARLIIESAREGSRDPLLPAATSGALLGLGVPAVMMILSGLGGGTLPVNVMTATAFLFPVCLGTGLIRLVLARHELAPAVSQPRS